MFYVFLIAYIICIYIYRHNRLLVFLFVLQIVSVLSAMIIKYESYDDNPNTFISVVYVIVSNSMLIIPWKYYNNLTIKPISKMKVNRLTNILLYISGFTFIILLIVAIVVFTFISDINEFKYAGGTGNTTEFYYTQLPFDVHLYLLARILYSFSYFLIPLHFFHAVNNDKKRSLWCAFLSTNIILYGMAFFSRWTIVLFVCSYIAMWFMFSNSMPIDVKKKELKYIKVAVVSISCFFIFISLARFGGDNNVNYANRIPYESPIQDPTLYSVFDYLGQSNSHSIYLLNNFKGNGFGLKWPFYSIQSLLSGLDIMPAPDVFEYHIRYWNDRADKFPGFAVYQVYEVGFLLAFLITLIIFLCIRSKSSVISIEKILVGAVLIQLPICSIFYSQLNEVCYDMLFFIPIYIYLKR